ncbi:PCLO [Symbiodinium natans]|uniref:PCLO protein n=1 Tax=Symbiodinium natans TaxID=878477 RepID=A0A812RVX1_9DINO|nr:PCLO [Symbiodinium natans]
MPTIASSPSVSVKVRNVVILACAIDAADKALLPATFGALAEQLQVGPSQLGMLNFAQSIAFSLALPFWGSLMQFYSPRDLLAGGCFLWGLVTLVIATSSNYMIHLMLRLVMGAALAVVAPIGQAMLCDLVPEAERGWVFGLLQSACTLLSVGVTFLTTGFARVLVAGVHGWRYIYAVVGVVSFFAATAVVTVIPPSLASPGMSAKGRSWWEEQARVVQLVLKKPSFIIMVSQGVTGGIPWNGFAFLPLYFQLSGFSDFRAGEIMLYGGLGGIVGGVLGGWLGDRFHRRWPYGGRCAVAQLSVLLGALLFVAVMASPARFSLVVCGYFAFQVVSCWTPAAALRPICGEIVRDSHDRAQILALWIALEGIISSFLGAPLVGVISEAFGCRLAGPGTLKAQTPEEVPALRSALLAVALIPWVLCGLAWFPMFVALAESFTLFCFEGPFFSRNGGEANSCSDVGGTSVVINFWQRYLEKLAAYEFLTQPDPSLSLGFNAGDKISYWDLSCGTWVNGFVKERVVDGQGDVAVAYHLDIKPSAHPQHVRRRLKEETLAKKAVDLIRRYVPLKADRALPGDLMRSMTSCFWSCIQQVPLVFRPVMTLPPQQMVINVPVAPPAPTQSRPQSPQPQSSRPRNTSSQSIPAAPSPVHIPASGPGPGVPGPILPPPAMPVFGYPNANMSNMANGSPNPGQMPPVPQNLPVFAFPQNRSGGQLPIFACPGPSPGPGGKSGPAASPGTSPALPVFAAPTVPGLALPPSLGPHTPRTPREEAPVPSPPKPKQIKESEAEWRNWNLRKGPASIEGRANEQESIKEVLSPGDESMDFEEFSDIRNSDGTIGVLMAPGQSRVML